MAHNEAGTGHEEKMCALTCCPCHLNLDKLKPLVKDPKYICSGCGHVAAEAKNLCEPKPLD